jgi:hypothetical protein
MQESSVELILHTIYSEIKHDPDNAITNLSNLLVGMVGTKLMGMFGGRIVTRYVMFDLKKWLYFRKCKSLANE